MPRKLVVLSISRLQRADPCSASVALPQDDTEHPARGRGNAVHAFLSDVTNGLSREDALAKVPEEHYEACAAIDLKQLPKLKGFASEVAFAFNVETGTARELGRGLERDYSDVGPAELPGTADLVALLPDGEGLLVGDFKTGRSPVAAAKKNWQLRALAIAACRTYGRNYAVVAVLTLQGDIVKYDQATLDAWDMAADALELKRIFVAVYRDVARVANGETIEVTTGAHCRYCPALAHCPAQIKLVLQLARDPLSVEREVMTLLTPETAALAWGRLKQIETVVKRVRETLYGWSMEHPIDCGNGLVFGPVEGKSRAVIGSIARNVLRDLYDDAVADAACQVATSQTAIEKALRPVTAKGGLAKAKRQVLKEIEKAGGIVLKHTTRMEEHVPSAVDGAQSADAEQGTDDEEQTQEAA